MCTSELIVGFFCYDFKCSICIRIVVRSAPPSSHSVGNLLCLQILHNEFTGSGWSFRFWFGDLIFLIMCRSSVIKNLGSNFFFLLFVRFFYKPEKHNPILFSNSLSLSLNLDSLLLFFAFELWPRSQFSLTAFTHICVYGSFSSLQFFAISMPSPPLLLLIFFVHTFHSLVYSVV